MDVFGAYRIQSCWTSDSCVKLMKQYNMGPLTFKVYHLLSVVTLLVKFNVNMFMYEMVQSSHLCLLGCGGPAQQQERQVRQCQEIPLCGLPRFQPVRGKPYSEPASYTYDCGYQDCDADGLQDGRRAMDSGNPCKYCVHNVG